MSEKSIDFYIGVKEVLDTFSKEFQERVDAAADTASKDTVKRLKNTSPRDTGDYAKSWSRKKVPGGYVVYNKNHPGLTHLLENGHALANQFGSLGKRVRAYPHIKLAEQEGIREFEELLK